VEQRLSAAEHLKQVKLGIAEIILQASVAQPNLDFELSSSYLPFLVNGGQPDIFLNFHYGPDPIDAPGQLLFSGCSKWSLYRNDRQFTLRFLDHPVYRLATLDHSFQNGEVYLQAVEEDASGESFSPNPDGTICVDPFRYPLDELIIINFLAQGRGVILHACGVVDSDRGLLFAGVSGAGKSTIAEVWKKTDATLLSDDRIIIRRHNGRWRMYGTPWHGDARIASPENAPLTRIYFLTHAGENYTKPLPPIEAASRLLVRCFPPFYERHGMESTLEFLSQVAAEVPCFELGFVPDDRIIDFVRGL
jgi:hypothetical protein